MRYGLVCLASFIASVLLGASAHAAENARVIKDWRAHCGSDRCSTETIAAEGRTTLRLSRPSKRGSPWHMSVRGLPSPLTADAKLVIRIDRLRPSTLSAKRGLAATGGEIYIADQPTLDFVFPMMKKGTAIRVTLRLPGSASRSWSYSLSGISATMLWIDERQGRVGEALRAAAPADAAPITKATADISFLPATLARIHRADEDCSDMADSLTEGKIIKAPLDGNHILYVVPCWSGAYNIFSRIYLYDARYPKAVKPELFATYGDHTGWYGSAHLVNADYDQRTNTLTAFEKYRGPGDCGSIAEYRWTENVLRLMTYRHWGKCDGSRGPDEWPVIFKFSKAPAQ